MEKHHSSPIEIVTGALPPPPLASCLTKDPQHLASAMPCMYTLCTVAERHKVNTMFVSA